jgi:hypothetical protein
VAEQGLTPARPGLWPLTGASGEDRRALPGYLDRLHRAADDAAAAAGGFHDAFCRLAGFDVRLRFAGAALMPRLLPALDHVRTAPADRPALTVRLFDSASTGMALPQAPWDDSVFRDHGKVHALSGGHVSGVFQGGTCSTYDQGGNEALYWVRSADDVEASETGSPLVTILHLWLATRGFQVAHAGAVGDASGCVLVVGRGGAGKSSTVLACLPSELSLLGEDYCVLELDHAPIAHTLFSSAKADATALERLPFLRPMVSNPDRPPSEKALCLLAQHVPEKLISRAPVRAIAIPRISGRTETTTSRASASAALAALAPSTLFQLRGSGKGALARLAGAVRAAPCSYLDVGTDPAGVASAISELLAR